jgi:hypothetical protein
MLIIETCNSHPNANIDIRLYVLHNFLLSKLSFFFTGLVPIYHRFQFGATFILTHNALLCWISKKHVTLVPKPTLLEAIVSWTIFHSVKELAVHRITPHVSPFLFWRIIQLVHNVLLGWIAEKHSKIHSKINTILKST